MEKEANTNMYGHKSIKIIKSSSSKRKLHSNDISIIDINVLELNDGLIWKIYNSVQFS